MTRSFRLVAVAAALALSAGCSPSLIQYAVVEADGQPRPAYWSAREPAEVRRDGLGLSFSPVGLDPHEASPMLRLTLIVRNDRRDPVTWAAAAAVRLGPPGGPAFPGLEIRRGPGSRSEDPLRIAAREATTFRIAVPVPDGPLPERLELSLDPTPWGDELAVGFRAPARAGRSWNRETAR